MKKHTNEGSFVVDVRQSSGFVGPMDCPQPGCEGGNVHFLIYGGYSGDYMTQAPCKCCDGKGRLMDEEPAYRMYCLANGVRDIRTGYPYPVPMSRNVYDDKDVGESVKYEERRRQKDAYDPKPYSPKSGCFLTTACVEYAGMTDDCEILSLMRKFRDEHVLKTEVGKLLVEEYYRSAPGLVSLVDELPEEQRNGVYDEALQLLSQVVSCVRQGQYQLAEYEYMKMYFRIRELTAFRIAT